MKKVLIVCCWLMFIGILPAFGQERNCQPIDSLKERLTQDKACAELSNMFERYRDCFCRENKYDDFVAYLKSLIPQKKSLQPLLDYAIALTRYNQLNCLESTQAWDEYFNKGPAYREELSAYLQESIKLTSVKDATHVYSQLLLWEFYRSQEDVSSMDVLVSLMQSLADYAKEAGDPAPLKAVADKILAAGEKARAK